MSEHTAPMKITMLMEISYFVFIDQITSINNSPTSCRFLKELIRDNLVDVDLSLIDGYNKERRSVYKTTPRGYAFIEKLCSTPLPVLEEKWV